MMMLNIMNPRSLSLDEPISLYVLHVAYTFIVSKARASTSFHQLISASIRTYILCWVIRHYMVMLLQVLFDSKVQVITKYSCIHYIYYILYILYIIYIIYYIYYILYILYIIYIIYYIYYILYILYIIYIIYNSDTIIKWYIKCECKLYLYTES